MDQVKLAHPSSCPSPFERMGAAPALFIFAALLAPVFALVAVYTYDWGQAEDFLMVDWYRRLFVSGEWTLIDLFAIRNGPHPLALQAAAAVLTFHVFGVHFSAIVILNALVIAATVVLLYAIAAPELRNLWAKLLVMASLALLLFHPAQANHLLWAFQLGWFLVTLLLVSAFFAVEKSGASGVPLAAFLCTLATLCSAQGAFVWLGVLTTLLLARRWVSAGCFFLGFAISIALLGAGGDSLSSAPKLHAFGIYVVRLLGTMFVVRDASFSLWVGLVVAAVVVALSVSVVRSANIAPRVERVAAGLVVYSAAATLGFALGRYKFGIEWAMDRFHATPLLTGLFLGPLLVMVSRADAGKGWTSAWRLVMLLFVAFCGASVLSSLPYAGTRAAEGQVARALGMRATCDKASPSYLAPQFNGIPHAPALVSDNWSLLSPLCKAQVPLRAYALQVLPDEFQRLVRGNGSFEEPLKNLWNVYGYRFDLQRAFPLTDLETPRRVIEFARNNANTGTLYETAVLKKHESVYLNELPK